MVANPKLDVEADDSGIAREEQPRDDEPGLDKSEIPGYDEDNELPAREDGEDWSDWL